MRLSRAFLIAGLLCAVPVLPASRPCVAQDAPANTHTLTEAMIPMRDGVRLYTRIIAPRLSTRALPIMLVRTPYGIDGNTPQSVAASWNFMHGGSPDRPGQHDYIYVFQDIRGKFKSEGEFVMLRPMRADRNNPALIDESTDTWDTIEWLLANVPNNSGRVGMTGVSYPGWLTVVAMLDPHPALKAASPQASPADMWKGDDFRHNGAFRLSYGFEYATMMESGKNVQQFRMDTYDTFDWYLRLGPLSAINEKHLHGRIPTWNDFTKHPDYDTFWKRQALTDRLMQVHVPTLNVAGWWDQEDFYGPITIYRALEAHDTEGRNRLVVGPWNHGGWMRGTGDSLGPIQFGQPTSRWFRDSVMAPFFAAHLHDAPETFTIDLHTQAYTFRTGHRVMIQVQSSWFPLIDRNPQTFVPNIFEAREADFRAATHQVYRSAARPSRIVLPVVTNIRP